MPQRLPPTRPSGIADARSGKGNRGRAQMRGGSFPAHPTWGQGVLDGGHPFATGLTAGTAPNARPFVTTDAYTSLPMMRLSGSHARDESGNSPNAVGGGIAGSHDVGTWTERGQRALQRLGQHAVFSPSSSLPYLVTVALTLLVVLLLFLVVSHFNHETNAVLSRGDHHQTDRVPVHTETLAPPPAPPPPPPPPPPRTVESPSTLLEPRRPAGDSPGSDTEGRLVVDTSAPKATGAQDPTAIEVRHYWAPFEEGQLLLDLAAEGGGDGETPPFGARDGDPGRSRSSTHAPRFFNVSRTLADLTLDDLGTYACCCHDTHSAVCHGGRPAFQSAISGYEVYCMLVRESPDDSADPTASDADAEMEAYWCLIVEMGKRLDTETAICRLEVQSTRRHPLIWPARPTRLPGSTPPPAQTPEASMTASDGLASRGVQEQGKSDPQDDEKREKPRESPDSPLLVATSAKTTEPASLHSLLHQARQRRQRSGP